MAILRAMNFYVGTQTGPGPNLLYTVPTGHRVILRSVQIVNLRLASNTVALLVNGAHKIVNLALATSPGSGAIYNLQPWIVLDAGATLSFTCASGTQCAVALSGSLLFI